MSATFTIRRGTPADTRAAFDVFLPSARDLTTRQGAAWDPDPDTTWTRMKPLLDRLGEHAAEWWVAEDHASGEMIGYARSVERGGLLELSEFFVHPDRQSAGVGAALLERAFPTDRGEVRAIIATTDMRAQARYYRAGTVARFPIVAVEGPPRASDPDAGIEITRLNAGDDIGPLVEIEASVLEFDRGDEFGWLLEQREGYLYRRGSRQIGFAFVSTTGVGPIAALEPGDQLPILRHVETRAAALEIETLSLEVAMINEVAMRHLLGRGFRIDPFITFLMSSRPFGQFDRFIGFSPPFTL